MPAPVNTSFLTAIDLGSLPATVVQNVHDAGVTYNVYYKFTAPAGSYVVIGAYGIGTSVSSGYLPTLKPYDGPAGAPVEILSIQGFLIPVLFPVTVATEYLLEILTSGGNPTPAVLTLNVQVAPTASAPVGSICVSDAIFGFPIALLSPTVDYSLLKFVNHLINGDGGDILSNGNMLLDDRDDLRVRMLDHGFNIISSLTVTAQASAIRANRGANNFYIGIETNPITVKTVTSLGAFGPDTFSLTGSTTIGGIAASNDETVLYFSRTTTNEPVRTWNLLTDVAGANLVAAVVNYQIIDILVLSDDSLLVLYFKVSSVRDCYVKHYSAAGATLHTYNFGSDHTAELPRLAYALDTPNSFWFWQHLSGVNFGIGRFQNIKISDGSTLESVDHIEFDSGRGNANSAITPPGRFGPSTTCPFFILTGAAQPEFRSGLYQIVPSVSNPLTPVKLNDTLYGAEGTTEDVEIPEPSATSYLLGDE